MINFKEYTMRKLKAAGFMVGGIFVILLGLAAAFSSSAVAWFFILLGLASFIYGSYLLNKLRYERENEGSRLYHYKGRF